MRASFSAAIVAAAVLLPAAALAQVPPAAAPPAPYAPPPAYGAPAYGAPAYGAPAYGAPAYGAPAYGAPPPASTPPVERSRAYSDTMFGTGLTMLIVGTSAALVGSGVYGAGSKTTYVYPDVCTTDFCEPTIQQKTGLKYAGAAMIALGSTSFAIGLPLMLAGMRRVPNTPQAAYVPEVRVGAGAGSLSWKF
jgi:hypothetical protein